MLIFLLAWTITSHWAIWVPNTANTVPWPGVLAIMFIIPPLPVIVRKLLSVPVAARTDHMIEEISDVVPSVIDASSSWMSPGVMMKLFLLSTRAFVDPSTRTEMANVVVDKRMTEDYLCRSIFQRCYQCIRSLAQDVEDACIFDLPLNAALVLIASSHKLRGNIPRIPGSHENDCL